MGTKEGEASRVDELARSLAGGKLSRRQAVAGLGATATAIVFSPVSSALGAKDCPNDRVRCDGKCCPKGARCRKGRCKCRKGKVKCGRKCVDTDSSFKHCGGCGQRCADGETCVEGVCTPPAQPDPDPTPQPEPQPDPDPAPATCSDGVRNGSETDVDCGGGSCPQCAFGRDCVVGGDCQSGICSGGKCRNCEPNSSSCTGGVQTTCPPDGSATTETNCAPYLCGPTACRTTCGFPADCAPGSCCQGGVCGPTNTETDVNNCGGCGVVCTAPNATVACAGGSCVIQSCHVGFADCDLQYETGCETNVFSDPNNCGTCGVPCGVGQACVAGVCT